MSGFSHGFRPIDGEAPPPTPSELERGGPYSLTGGVSQKDFRPDSADFASSTRKRRRFPGPLAFHHLGSGAGSGAYAWGRSLHQQSDPGSFRYPSRSDLDSEGSDGEGGEEALEQGGGEIAGGHFSKGPWLKLCDALDVPLPREGATNVEALQVFVKESPSPIAGVLAGQFDLRVPTVTAVIDSVSKPSETDLVAILVDPSGRMEGYFHPQSLHDHGAELTAGAALVLQDVGSLSPILYPTLTLRCGSMCGSMLWVWTASSRNCII
ncbi:unnamed protein product [Discosporangium mesarthrocarpum]